MLANHIPAIYNKLEIVDNELHVVASEISLRDLFNCKKLSLDELNIHFESSHE